MSLIHDKLQSDKTYASTLLVICVDTLGTECFEWEPESIFHELNRVHRVEMPESNQSKIMAMITLLTTDWYYQDVNTFYQTNKALVNEAAKWGTLSDDMNSDDMGRAWIEISLNDPDRGTFTEEIREYMRYVFRQEGFVEAPSLFAFANPLSQDDSIDSEDIHQSRVQREIERQKEFQSIVRDWITGLQAELDEVVPALKNARPADEVELFALD